MSTSSRPFTIAEVAAAMGARLLHGDPDREASRVSIDTRTLARGDMFVAIKGDRFDGHAFVGDALAAGAAALVVSDAEAAAASPVDVCVLVVDDTTRALQSLARHVRRASGSKVVAITGSAGKTTTKELAADFLSTRFTTIRTQGNLNNHIGLPLSLLELRAAPQVAVFELGMNHPGEIRALVNIAEPDIRVWTNVGRAHLGNFTSLDELADAKAEILENATSAQQLVANRGDSLVMARVGRFPGRVSTFGVDCDATFSAVDVELRGVSGSRARLRTPDGDFALSTPLLGRGHLANVVAALAVASICGVPIAAAIERAASSAPVSHRGEVVRLRGAVVVIDDVYNANPEAMTQALAMLRSETSASRRVAVLGEMLELGDHADALHRACGYEAAECAVDLLVTVGGAPARAMGASAIEHGLAPERVAHSESAEAAAELVVESVRAGDVVLVKGSRGIGLERVVERMRQRFA